jgi:hypothetical protein
MAILVENKNMGGGHWYQPDGTPLHQVPKADGKGMRDTTLADAKKLGLLPSVTGITDIVAKPALMNWKAAQVAAAAFENPPTSEESAEYFIERVINASHHQVAGAADLGSKVHDGLEKLLTHGPDAVAEDMWAYVAPVVAWKKEAKITYDQIENVLVNLEIGYAGRCDVLGHDAAGAPVIIDYKTRKTKPKQVCKPYDTQGMQLAAYAVAHYGLDRLPEVKAWNVYISTTEVGRVEGYQHESLLPHWEAFKAAAILWSHIKGYDPRRPVVHHTQGGGMSDKDPIVSALMFSSQMTLDLVWALGWWTAIDQSAFKVFRRELEERRKVNFQRCDACAKEAGI